MKLFSIVISSLLTRLFAIKVPFSKSYKKQFKNMQPAGVLLKNIIFNLKATWHFYVSRQKYVKHFKSNKFVNFALSVN